MTKLNVPLTASSEPINADNALSEYSLTHKLWRSQTFGKLRDWILGSRGACRGDLQATSGVFPTAMQVAGTQYETTWTLAPGSSLVLANSGKELCEPMLPGHDRQFGWWFVSEVGGNEVYAVFIPFELRRNTREAEILTTRNRSVPGRQLIVVSQERNGNFKFVGDGDTLPANTVLKIYMAVT